MSDLMKCHATKSGSIVTPRGRAFFCAIAEKFKKKDAKADDNGAYVVTIVIPPDSDLTLLKNAIKAKAKEKWGDKMPGNLKSPIRLCKEVLNKDGDEKYPPELANHFQITANTYQQQPGVINAKGDPVNKLLPNESVDDLKQRVKDECYSGRWMRISVSPATYDTDGNRGVKLYLQNVQLLDHDDVIGGRSARAEDDFAPVGGVAEAPASAKAADSIFD